MFDWFGANYKNVIFQVSPAVDILGQVFEKNVVLFIHTFGRTGDGSCELLLW